MAAFANIDRSNFVQPPHAYDLPTVLITFTSTQIAFAVAGAATLNEPQTCFTAWTRSNQPSPAQPDTRRRRCVYMCWCNDHLPNQLSQSLCSTLWNTTWIIVHRLAHRDGNDQHTYIHSKCLVWKRRQVRWLCKGI